MLEYGEEEIKILGGTEYRFKGSLHRKDGPARTFDNGVMEWWLNGKPFDNFENWIHEAELTEEEIIYLKLKYAT
ncbi:hypothetical protein [Beijerinckia mobilis]|uniref:hypothetical protein n=1 Tax=Beijerinckia mobilis TaxID=231434 RepID=UPI0005576E07|nr:hypothetical protein [Beijerinckia mobilis]